MYSVGLHLNNMCIPIFTATVGKAGGFLKSWKKKDFHVTARTLTPYKTQWAVLYMTLSRWLSHARAQTFMII